MITKSQAKRRQDIKTKLMAAIAMLLVSSIMMVSSTYAWFTLSTAPEVTGITTQVGANGNLEMALMPVNGVTVGATYAFGITSGSNDGTLAIDKRNVTWGNLVDVSNNTLYGMDKISLYPSALNVTDAGALAASMLKTPEYGSDGRVSGLAEKTVTGIYGNNVFNQSADTWGVRAVGVSSAMTPRQIAYRNALSAANTAMSMAKSLASSSLSTNGNVLANIALAHAVDENAKHSQQDVQALIAITDSLLGAGENKGVIEYIEDAYKNYVLAWIASNKSPVASNDNDVQYAAAAAVLEPKTIYEIVELTSISTEGGAITVSIPDAVKTPVGLLKATKQEVTEANTALKNITGDEIAWSAISDPLHKLADTSAMKINGYAASTVKDNMNAIVTSVMGGGGLTVTMATGGGVYADVADHCGDYTASINIKEVSYGGMTLENMPARMATASTLSTNNNNYLVVMSGQFGDGDNKFGSPAGGGAGSTMPITEFYGYVIDLAFRTNAAESKLLLQTEAENRIYDENGSEETMGHGSTMTFTSTTTDFTAEQLAGLMDAIRVVFFDPTNSSVYAYAKLDMEQDHYTVTGGNTITAKLYIYETTAESYNVVAKDATFDANTTYYTKSGEDYIEVTDRSTLPATAPENIYYTKVAASENLLNQTGAEQVITDLNQNTAKAVSALVYLDGEHIQNAHVAATAETTMTGSMNLQFASSANLVPMKYAPLMNQTNTPAQGGGNQG